MIVTVFRSRHLPGVEDEYMRLAKRMGELAANMPGYISHKGFVAEDGERLTLVEFESEDAQRAWRMHPEHRQTQKYGREHFYAEYDAKVCAVIRESKFKRDGKS